MKNYLILLYDYTIIFMYIKFYYMEWNISLFFSLIAILGNHIILKNVSEGFNEWTCYVYSTRGRMRAIRIGHLITSVKICIGQSMIS